MKQRFFCLLVMASFVLSGSLFAQITETIEWELEKDQRVFHQFYIPGKGLYVKTGDKPSQYSKDRNWKIWHFDETGELQWKVPVLKDRIVHLLPKYVLASDKSDYTYHLEVQLTGLPAKGNQFYVTQINGEGEQDHYTLNTEEECVDWFVAKSGLFGIIYNNLGMFSGDGPEFGLYRFNHQNREQQYMEVDLPDDIGEGKTTDWSFLDFKDESMFFSCKEQVKGDDTAVTIHVAVVSLEGELVKTISIPLKLSGNKTILPQLDSRYYSGLQRSYQGYKLWTPPGSKDERIDETVDSYGALSFNEDESFYVYGLFDDENVKPNKVVDGMYIFHYSPEGDVINEAYLEVGERAGSFEKSNRGLVNLRTYLHKVPGKGLVLSFLSRNEVYSFDLNENLELEFMPGFDHLDYFTTFGSTGFRFIETKFAPEYWPYLKKVYGDKKELSSYGAYALYFGEEGRYCAVFEGKRYMRITFFEP
ncbi:MAG: hypothetical protein GYB31_19710 [Bacteroidetes bacterium]|nr:hypothetical protein [Bacteroidota bacterium]